MTYTQAAHAALEARITLAEFEAIDSLLSQQLRAGQFETCADPVGYVRTSNRLLDACIDAMGYNFVDHFPSAEDAAAAIVARALTHADFVRDEEAFSQPQNWPQHSYDGAADRP